MAAIGAIGVIGMIGNVSSAGYDSATQTQGILDSISKASQAKLDWQSKFENLDNQYTKLDSERIDLNLALVNEYASAHEKIDAAHKKHKKLMLNIQITGLIFVTSIFFLLLLKELGFLKLFSLSG